MPRLDDLFNSCPLKSLDEELERGEKLPVLTAICDCVACSRPSGKKPSSSELIEEFAD